MPLLRLKAVEARKIKAEMRRKQAESKTDDIIEDNTIVNEPIVNNDGNVNMNQINDETTNNDGYVTESQLNDILNNYNVHLQTNRKSKYKYVDGMYVKIT